jgi:hypothetical protein
MRAPSDVRPSALVALSLSFCLASSAFAQTSGQASQTDPVSTPAEPNSEPRSLADSLTEQAKREYELGRLLYDNGDYEGALARFEAARAESGDNRLLWNEAICHKALHHYAHAIVAMRGYLVSGAVISDSEATSARNFMAAAERLTARLEVSSDVSGAVVFADGESVGNLPLRLDVRLDWGAHQIVVRKAGYLDYEQTVDVDSTDDVRVVAVLRPVVHEGRVVVRAGGGDAIAIDGRARARTTWEGVLPSGVHSLRVSASGFRPHEQPIVVADAQTRGFDVVLEREHTALVPAWVWITGGAVLAAGAVTAGYFAFRPSDSHAAFAGSIKTVQLDLRR